MRMDWPFQKHKRSKISLVHLLLILGGRTDHDEEQVDKIAARLAQACPEVLTLCGLTNKFTGKQTETNSL